MNKKKSFFLSFVGLVLLVALVNIVSQFAYYRIDLTRDQRYTLSSPTLKIIDSVKEPLELEVYLEGDFPAEFRKLQEETKQLIQEFTSRNANIYVRFTNPLASPEKADQLTAQLFANGMKPLSIQVNDKGKQSQEMVFPWAVAKFGNKQAKIPLIKNVMGTSIEEKVNVSVQHLEYAFANAIHQVTTQKSKKIAVIKGIGGLDDVYVADMLLTLREQYFIAPFTLDSIASDPNKALKELKEYDLALFVKPSVPFSDQSIQVLDQYVMNGGKSIWMIDQVKAEIDSLYQTEGALAYPQDFGELSQMFFKYGIRINPNLVKDEMGTPLKLAVGQQGSETVYENFIWKFAPYAVPTASHPIVKNVDGIKLDFVSAIDTLHNSIRKTVLLHSSPYSMAVGTPFQLKLDMVNDQTPLEAYQNKGNLPLAVLLEGPFTSVYKNRILPFKQADYLAQGKNTQMIVIADGDVIKNQLDSKNQPLETGYDKWTNTLYGNKEFVLNAVNYLLDDNGLINIRTKDVQLPLLNKEKVYQDYTRIQVLTVALPVVILFVLGFAFLWWRRKKYQR